MPLKILIAAGGTGGHLFPAIAVTEELRAIQPDIQFEFVGTNRIESRIVPELGYNFYAMNIYGITKILSLKTALLPFRLARAEAIVRKLIKKNKFDAVICTGAYLSYPPGVAAHKEKVPLFLLESNVNPGKSIKMLSSRADTIFSSFESTASFFNPQTADKVVYTGNPVRPAIKKRIEKSVAAKKYNLDPEKPIVLVFGGSLGAWSINNAIADLVDRVDYQIIWQTGKNYSYEKKMPKNIVKTEFIDDMATAYSAADLIVSRSGATTVAELGIVAKPSILIPLPSASNNEQHHNAKAFEGAGASILLNDEELAEKLGNKIETLLSDIARLKAMSAAAHSLGKPNAGAEVAKIILGKLNGKYRV